MSCGLPLVWQSRKIAEHLKEHARTKSPRGQVQTATAMLWGKCIHIDTAVHKACIHFRMLDEMFEAVGAPCGPDRENADALFLPIVMQPRKSVLLNAALSGSVLFSPSSVLLGTGPLV